jgi:acyl-CoA synthetase (AMP-forming)/AMP-acid ligase II
MLACLTFTRTYEVARPGGLTPRKRFDSTRGSRAHDREFDAGNCAARRRPGARGRPGELFRPTEPILFFYFACFKIGAWAGPVNSLLKPKEIEFIVSNSEAKIVVTESSLLSGLDVARANIDSLHDVLVVDEPGGSWSVVEQIEDPGVRVPGSPSEAELGTRDSEPHTDDEAVIIYTSGTTGKTQRRAAHARQPALQRRQIAEWLRLTDQDRSLMIMPLFHVNALMTTCLATL